MASSPEWIFVCEPVCEQPPLLHSWKAQREALMCVEVFGIAGRLWVLTASADGSASMWTQDGDRVGCFGQQVLWQLAEPSAHQRSEVIRGLATQCKQTPLSNYVLKLTDMLLLNEKAGLCRHDHEDDISVSHTCTGKY